MPIGKEEKEFHGVASGDHDGNSKLILSVDNTKKFRGIYMRHDPGAHNY